MLTHIRHCEKNTFPLQYESSILKMKKQKSVPERWVLNGRARVTSKCWNNWPENQPLECAKWACVCISYNIYLYLCHFCTRSFSMLCNNSTFVCMVFSASIFSAFVQRYNGPNDLLSRLNVDRTHCISISLFIDCIRLWRCVAGL